MIASKPWMRRYPDDAYKAVIAVPDEVSAAQAEEYKDPPVRVED